MEQEIPKYRKKSTKKPPKKANHKHKWASCVYQTDSVSYSKEKGFYKTPELTVGTYCSVCGKIGLIHNPDFIVQMTEIINGNRYYSSDWSNEAKKELDPATRTLPLFIVDQFKDKFVMTTVSSDGSHI